MDDGTGLVRLTFSQLTLLVQTNSLPASYRDYVDHAAVVEEFALEEAKGTECFVGARWGSDWPVLVLGMRYWPSGPGWDPGVALVPETWHLFVGAGTRLLAYDLSNPVPRRVLDTLAGGGFLRWRVDGGVVTMAAERQLAAWDNRAKALWTVEVDPPGTYRVEAGRVHLEAGSETRTFWLAEGPTGSGE